ncbi:aldehyde dehydrogenase family protein [Bacteriovorax sp. PP10]|uniref:Aldehyde dehydrogenase family protein n=1 Tax=Bacteriovorax antarcticus TaxID=3088717 RepID=A0ABU5VY80_9BACT|nr:aldehyde dehydrogenase family protein [Bacteriovorax sp. PP10]MEA9358023.1 aldehyde dehydrogenase family protein [Bacteriovorax sp. PP10]
MEIKLFINGQFKDSSDKTIRTSYDPSNGAEVAKYHVPSSKDVDEAVTAARDAFYNPEWKNMSQDARADILLKISEKLKERSKEIVDIEVRDSGSTLRKAKADVHNTAAFFKVMSKVARELKLSVKDETATRAGFSINSREYAPVGVCAQIIPWNFPLVMAGWKLGPILATGCTTVLKTAEETPASAAILAEIIRDSGVPAGVVNIITGGADVGRALLSHREIQKVAFTGSTAVGKEILKTVAPNITTATMELGGKSANIVLDDADLSIAVDGALYAFLYHSGQACDSGTRLLVQEGIYDAFMEKFLERIKDVKVAPTTDPNAGYGPVVNEKQMKTILGFIEKTKSEDGKLLAGGNRITTGEFAKGFFIEPTAFEITPKHTIFQEEIFGPVVGITKFRSEEEAVLLANNSKYGLAGAVWSKDSARAHKVASQLEAGTVWINEYHLLNPGMPFGGFKESGLGREMGPEGIMSYLEVRHVWESDCNEREKKVWLDAIF